MLVDIVVIWLGVVVCGCEIVWFVDLLIYDNFEGVVVLCEGGDMVVWMVFDDNDIVLEWMLLLKFRFDC